MGLWTPLLLVVFLCQLLFAVNENVSTLAEWDDDGYQNLCRLRVGCRCPFSDLSTFVDCSNLQLTDLPSNIVFPKQIIDAQFQNNYIQSVVQSTFYHSPSVETLDMANNSLQFIEASSFVAFENLVELRLSHNKLADLPEMAFDGLNNLKTLDLSHNELSAIRPIVFRYCPLLVELKLHSNPLKSLQPNSFEYLPMLEHLTLQDTQLKELPGDIFLNNPLLGYLSLANNLFFDIPTRSLAAARHLKSLDFSNTRILEVKPHAFRGLTNLTVLYLDHQSEMLTIEKHAFSGLAMLETLHCSYNPQLTYIHAAAFEDKWSGTPSRLLQLHIRDNQLKMLSPGLLPWSSVDYVDLRGNPWLCDCHLKWITSGEVKRNNLEGVRCASPKKYSGQEVVSLSADDYTCSPILDTKELLALLVVLSTFFVFTVAIFLFLVCRHSVCVMVRARMQHRYVEVLPTKKSLEDLEWDYSADP